MARRTKLERYDAIRKQVAELVRGVGDPLARRATAAALLHHKLPDVSWTGFYMLREGRLLVDAYQGPVACIELPAGRGVCWAGIEAGEAVVVPDVAEFAGHVACDERTRSEIVVPLFSGGEPVGVLDLDSRRAGRFDREDVTGLGGIARLVESPR